jgi:hypothetical protein
VTVRYNAVATQFETEAVGEATFHAPIQAVMAGNSQESVPLFIKAAPLVFDGKAPQMFYIHFWGEVRYNDVMSSELRRTRFRFRATIQRTVGSEVAQQVGEWLKFGPEVDNNAI